MRLVVISILLASCIIRAEAQTLFIYSCSASKYEEFVTLGQSVNGLFISWLNIDKTLRPVVEARLANLVVVTTVSTKVTSSGTPSLFLTGISGSTTIIDNKTGEIVGNIPFSHEVNPYADRPYTVKNPDLRKFLIEKASGQSYIYNGKPVDSALIRAVESIITEIDTKKVLKPFLTNSKSAAPKLIEPAFGKCL